ncbi:hypothetical protein [Ideonella margarita]|uniref:Uncharacterized protein n=1 Tax=Ideonella margarita TaxID=2984191 RepID=A0ABU9CBQ7_9BURK
MQALLTAAIVLACACYATWALMPVSWRRRVANRALSVPQLAGMGWLQRAARRGGACGCDGCDGPPAGASKSSTSGAAVQVITLHPRRPAPARSQSGHEDPERERGHRQAGEHQRP